MCCSRQSGKSACAAALALIEALLCPPAEVLIIAKSLRQSTELLRKVKELYRGLRGEKVRRHKWTPIPFRTADEVAKHEQEEEALRRSLKKPIADSVLQMEFENGSRIISLPGTPDTIVGYSAIDLLIMDEASRIPDDLYRSVRPMLAVSRAKGSGKLVALSTPFGKRGWFWEAHQRCVEAMAAGKKPPWEQVRITVDQCPRIGRDFLEEELLSIGQRWYDQEYGCIFGDAVDQLFKNEDIKRVFSSEVVRRGLPDCVEV